MQYLLGNRYSLLQLWKKLKNRRDQKSSKRTITTSPKSRAMLLLKNSSHNAKHKPSERQRMYCMAKEMLTNARQKKHGSHPTILARWYSRDKYRNSLPSIGWTEKDIMLFDRFALENHSYVATKAERIQNSKRWILTRNKEGAQQPQYQRPDFAQAKRECKRLHDEHVASTKQDYRTIPRSQQA